MVRSGIGYKSAEPFRKDSYTKENGKKSKKGKVDKKEK